VTLEEIDNVDDFVAKLEKIEPPAQMVSFLADPLLQKLVDLKPSPITDSRIELWLATYLEEEYNAARSGLEASPDLTDFLDSLYKHTHFTKVRNTSFI
jgi:centromere protein I